MCSETVFGTNVYAQEKALAKGASFEPVFSTNVYNSLLLFLMGTV